MQFMELLENWVQHQSIKDIIMLWMQVEMAQKIYERPVKVTKDIYPVIARKYKSTPSNVEHNIRTLVNLCWMNHKDTLEEMAGCTMADKPTNSEFIDILVYYLRYSDKD